MIRRSLIIVFCLQMFCCLSLTAKTVAYTIVSKTVVRMDGEEPIGSYVEYSQTAATGKNGQMTAGNSTTLVLSGYEGMRLNRLTLMMHSNQTMGAGWLEVKSGTDMLWTIPNASFASNEWAGNYTTEWMPVTYTFPQPYTVDGMLSIHIQATENSLYINSYTIEYQPVPTMPYLLSFSTHTDVAIPPSAEEYPGAGVVLPDFDYDDSRWHFLGWNSLPIVEESTQCNSLLLPGTHFFPDANTTLHAVYADGIPLSETLVQDTILQSGYYLMADARYMCLATSAVNRDKRLYTMPIRLDYSNLYSFQYEEFPAGAVYAIDFRSSDSTVSIRHLASNQPIGYHPAKHLLQNTDTVWSYSVLPNHTVRFFFEENDDMYSLFTRTGTTLSNIDSVWYQVGRRNPDKLENVLFRVDDYLDPPTIHYTSYPQGYDALLNNELMSLTVTSAGIHNPHEIWFSIYDLQGNCLCTTNQCTISFKEYPLLHLPTGIYILCADEGSRCFIVP